MRKGPLVATLLSSLLVAGLLAGPAGAHVSSIDTTLSINRSPAGAVGSGDPVLVFGKIKPGRCADGQLVRVFRARPGADDLLGSDNLDGDGEYSVTIHPNSTQRVYAKVGSSVIVSNYEHTHKCKGDRSPKIRINVG